MKRKGKIAGTIATLIVAFLILSVSVLKATYVKNAYSQVVLSEETEEESNYKPVDYLLAYPGKIGPDHILWYSKVARDKIWYALTFNKAKKAEISLLFADKRLNSSLELFKNNKPDLGFSTLTKAEKYLETSESLMSDDEDFYKKIGLASLKHREVIEKQILPLTPEDLRPEVIKINDYPKETYKKVRDHMLSKGLVPPQNPFESN